MISEQEVANPPADPEHGPPIGLFGLARWQLVTLIVALCLLAGLVGALIAQPRDEKFSDVDVGFLSDMSYHHSGAIGMSFAYLENTNDELVGHFAREIIMAQAQETGVMNTLLDRAGDVESASDEIAMDWMGMPILIQRMPGMATNGEFDELTNATGLRADDVFTRLMLRHHTAGVAMANFAARNGQSERVRQLATKMAKGQRSEIIEMHTRRAQLGLPRVDLNDLEQQLDHGHK